MTQLTLKYVASDSFDRPVYVDLAGKLYADVDPRENTKGAELFTLVDNCFGGEPLSPVKFGDDVEVEFVPCRITWSNKSFRYSMLARLRTDCEYFLNWGRRRVSVLPSGSVSEHIAVMRSY